MTIKHFGTNSRAADMTESQDDKYISNNDQLDVMADRTQRKMNLFVGISSGNTLVLGSDDFTENLVFHCRAEPGSPSLDGDWVLQVPAISSHFAVFNDTAFTMYVESGGSPGAQVEIADGGRADLHTDGETVIELKRDTYDLSFVANTITEDNIMGAHIAPRPFTIPAGADGSAAYVWTNLAAGEAEITVSLQKNEVEFGTVVFTALDQDGTVTIASDADFVKGDRLRLIVLAFGSPTTAMSASDMVISLRGSA